MFLEFPIQAQVSAITQDQTWLLALSCNGWFLVDIQATICGASFPSHLNSDTAHLEVIQEWPIFSSSCLDFFAIKVMKGIMAQNSFNFWLLFQNIFSFLGWLFNRLPTKRTDWLDGFISISLSWYFVLIAINRGTICLLTVQFPGIYGAGFYNRVEFPVRSETGLTGFLGLVNIFKGKSLECLSLKIACNSCINNIWRARNLALHQSRSCWLIPFIRVSLPKALPYTALLGRYGNKSPRPKNWGIL